MISTERIQPNLVTVADMDAADAIDLIHEAQAYKAGKQAVLTRLTSSLKTQLEQRPVSKWHK